MNTFMGCCSKAFRSGLLRGVAAALVILMSAAAPTQAATAAGTDGGPATASMEPALAGLLALAALAAMWWRLLARSDEQGDYLATKRRCGRTGAAEDG